MGCWRIVGLLVIGCVLRTAWSSFILYVKLCRPAYFVRTTQLTYCITYYIKWVTTSWTDSTCTGFSGIWHRYVPVHFNRNFILYNWFKLYGALYFEFKSFWTILGAPGTPRGPNIFWTNTGAPCAAVKVILDEPLSSEVYTVCPGSSDPT